MENIILNMVKLLLIRMKENNILEVDENELRENFYKFKNSKKYQKYFYSYIYDENGICIKFEKELKSLIIKEQIIKYNNYLYINMNTNDNHFSKNLNNITDQMISDYIKFNMEKQKIKN